MTLYSWHDIKIQELTNFAPIFIHPFLFIHASWRQHCMQIPTTSIFFCTWHINVGVVQPETFTRRVCEWNANTPAKLISSLSCTPFNKGSPEKEQSQTQKSYVLEQSVLQHLQASIHQTANYSAVAKQVQAIWNDASWMQKQKWCSGWLYYDWFDVTFSQTEK